MEEKTELQEIRLALIFIGGQLKKIADILEKEVQVIKIKEKR
jgi:hypothetical protein